MSSGGKGRKNNNVEMQQQESEQLLKLSNKEAIGSTGIQDDDNDLDLQEESHRVDGGVRKSGTEGA